MLIGAGLGPNTPLKPSRDDDLQPKDYNTLFSLYENSYQLLVTLGIKIIYGGKKLHTLLRPLHLSKHLPKPNHVK